MALMPPIGGGQADPAAAGAAAGGPPPSDLAAARAGAGQQMPPRSHSNEGEMSAEAVADFVQRGYTIIYGGDSPEGQLATPIANMLRRNASDPVHALADTAAQVSARVASAAVQHNMSLDPAAVLAGTFQLVEELASVASAEGIYDYDQNEMNAAATQAAQGLAEQTKDLGIFSPEEMMSDAGWIAQESQSGGLNEAMSEMERASQPPVGAGLMGATA